jgi:Zn-dependent protease/predicted transcriptional regulator
MNGSGSIRLFNIRGITLRVHFTFPLILVWAALQFGLFAGLGTSGAIFGILVTLLLFVIVVLHELGHSVVAQHYGIPVKDIVLLPIGGVAQMSRIPEEPVQEFFIAIAGPLVNFALAGLMILANLAFGLGGGLSNPLALLYGFGAISVASIFNYLFVANLFLGLFNLLPAFPMDGGRILRALLATRLNYVRATDIAAVVGKLMAILLGAWGVFGGGIFLILIAFFVFIEADQEGKMVKVRNMLRGLTVAQAYSAQARALSPQATVGEAMELALSSLQSDFPVVDGGQVVGLLTKGKLIEALNQGGPAVPVGEVMIKDVQPVTPAEELYDAQQQMAESQLNALPVVEAGRYTGLVTSRGIRELIQLVSAQRRLNITKSMP